jgi:Ca2+-binding RTX toxin-like protein
MVTSLRILIAAAVVTILYALPNQIWSEVNVYSPIYCPLGATRCEGTPGDDFIFPSETPNLVIDGKAGDDYILGSSASDSIYIFGGEGNDILIGGHQNDGLYGGTGNDKYDGGGGSDTIIDLDDSLDPSRTSDIASGGEGDDYITLYGGSDRIHGGPGADAIYAEPPYRDFSVDIIDCGSAADFAFYHSGDGDSATNCETVQNPDR